MTTPSLPPPPPSTPHGWLRQLWDTIRGAADLAPSLGTVVNTKGTQTLEGKSISGASNTLSDVSPSALARPYFFARNVSNQSAASGVATVVIFPQEDHDSHGAFAGSSGVFTVPAGHGGVYHLDAAVLFDPAGATLVVHRMSIVKNGATVGGGSIEDTASNFTQLRASCLLTLVAGDTVRVEALQTNGAAAAKNIQGDPNYTYFMGWRIA